MRVKHYTGTVVDVPEAKAAKLASSGSWVYVDKPVEPVKVQNPDPVLAAPRLPEPQEDVKPVATIPEMRAWALKNEIPGVKAKGKLSREAIEAYQEAHKDERGESDSVRDS